MIKKCSDCGQEKPIEDFYRNNQRLDGRTGACKPCIRGKLAASQMNPNRPNAARNGMKRCTLCKETKSVSEFSRDKAFSDGLAAACKACRIARFTDWYAKADKAKLAEDQRRRYRNDPDRYAEYERKSHYGLERGAYAQMLAAQDGKCAICESTSPGGVRIKHFHVDHCHETGRIRGLLCGPCNTGIGQLQHSEALLLSAVKYLEKHSK